MVAVLCLTLFFLLVIYMIVHMSRTRGYFDDGIDDEEVVTTHTTVTTTTVDVPQEVAQPAYTIVGDLKRSKARNGQFYVMDPVDKDKVFLNSTDDLYEDGAGKVWRLV